MLRAVIIDLLILVNDIFSVSMYVGSTPVFSLTVLLQPYFLIAFLIVDFPVGVKNGTVSNSYIALNVNFVYLSTAGYFGLEVKRPRFIINSAR